MRRMPMIAFFFYLLLLVPALAQLQTTPPCEGRDILAEMKSADPNTYAAIRADADATANGRGIFWRIEGQGSRPSFLFGTVHSTDPRVNALSPDVWLALDGADTVALELVELASGKAADAIKEVKDIARLILYLEGGGLAEHLTESELSTLRTWMSKIGVPPEVAVRFRPWFAWLSLAIPACEAERTAAGVPVLDQQIGQGALKRGRRVVGLETVDTQINALAGISEATQVFMLKTSLALIDGLLDQWEVLHQLYLARDVGAVWPFGVRIAEKAGFDVGPFEQVARELIEKRNLAMRDAALPLLKEGNAFIAVGAVHLVGTSGLVELFRAAGYTVTPVL